MLEHTFINGANTRTLPSLTAEGQAGQVLGEYDDEHSFEGGALSAAGKISAAELAAFPLVYQFGATWLVRDTETPAGEYLFGGSLNDPEPSEKAVQLSAKGWGAEADVIVERLLLQNAAAEQWQPDGLGYKNDEEIQASINGRNLRWKVNKKTKFKANNLNKKKNGADPPWESGIYFWSPEVDIRKVAFTVRKKGNSDRSNYTIIVRSSTGPAQSTATADSWSLGGGDQEAHSADIAPGKSLVGIIIKRDGGKKRAPRMKFWIPDARVWGDITQAASYNVTAAVTMLLTRVGCGDLSVGTSTVDVLPYDALGSSLADLLDEFTSYAAWYWRIYPNSSGARRGEAQALGFRTWNVVEVHQTHRIIPSQRFNRVAYTYVQRERQRMGLVTANPNPFPSGVFRTYNLSVDDPNNQGKEAAFAQKVADFLATRRPTGDATLSQVEDPAAPGVAVPATRVRPGDALVFPGNQVGIVARMKVDGRGRIIYPQLADGDEMLKRILDVRHRRFA